MKKRATFDELTDLVIVSDTFCGTIVGDSRPNEILYAFAQIFHNA